MRQENSETLLTDRIERLERSQLESQTSFLRQLNGAEERYRRAEIRSRLLGGTALAVLITSILIYPGNRAAIAQGYGVTLQSLAAEITAAQANIAALQTKTQFMSASGKSRTTMFSACNVVIQNGMGATTIANGLGNLTIGYNATGNVLGDSRGGSHNLILGDANNYSSYGGIVAGHNNAISAQYATITGGEGGIANGGFSSISGGSNNQAFGLASTCTGGFNNFAFGSFSNISGGGLNQASGYASAVSGGANIPETIDYGWAAGGYQSP